MVYLIVFYWIVCGFTEVALLKEDKNEAPIVIILAFILAMLLGGFIIPARAIVKLAK